MNYCNASGVIIPDLRRDGLVRVNLYANCATASLTPRGQAAAALLVAEA